MISNSEREAYERLHLPLALCSSEEGKTHAEVVTDGLCEAFGLSREQMCLALRSGMTQYTHPDDVSFLFASTLDFLSGKCNAVNLAFRIRRSPESDYFLVHVIGSWQTVADGSRYAMLVFSDMSGTESGIAKVFTAFGQSQSDLIYKDGTTGLYNMNYMRQFANDRIQKLIALGREPMMMAFDVVGMQNYNTLYGYTNGDRLIRIVAEELTSECSPEGKVFRGSDDSFYVLDVASDQNRVQRCINRCNDRIKARAYGVTKGVRAGAYVIGQGVRATTAMDRAGPTMNYETREERNERCDAWLAGKE